MVTLRQPCPSRRRLTGVAEWSIALLIGATAGCASAPPTEYEIAYARSMRATTELATTAAEEQALERAASLPSDEAVPLEGQTVLAGPIYTAASGRRCRELRIGAGTRLACESLDGEGWVFVPHVFTQPISEGVTTRSAPDEPTAEASEEGSS